MKAAKFLILLALPIFSGCSTLDNLKSFTTAYHEPQPPTTSRLRVTTDQLVRAVPNSTCINWDLPDVGMINSRSSAPLNDRTHNDKTLGIPGGEGLKNSAEVYIRPDQPLTLVYSGASSRYQCVIGIHFVPEAGADYESTSEFCVIRVSKIVKNATTGQVTREPVTGDRVKVCP